MKWDSVGAGKSDGTLTTAKLQEGSYATGVRRNPSRNVFLKLFRNKGLGESVCMGMQ